MQAIEDGRLEEVEERQKVRKTSKKRKHETGDEIDAPKVLSDLDKHLTNCSSRRLSRANQTIKINQISSSYSKGVQHHPLDNSIGFSDTSPMQ